MGFTIAALEDVPVAGWIVLLAVAAFVGEFAALHLRRGRSGPRAREAERRLILVATALRNHAVQNLQRLPASLEELSIPGAEALTYRPMSRLNLDARLVLLHDRAPTQKVIEFPVLRDGRSLVLCSGRMLVVSEEAFEKLIAADDALRERLGLEPATAKRPEEKPEHGPRA